MTITLTKYIKFFPLTNHRWAITILIVLVSTFLHLPVQAFDFQACNDCHDDVIGADHGRYNLHSPFAQQQCGKCHAATKKPVAPVKKKSPLSVVGRNKRQKINWLGNSTMMDTSHGFKLPGGKIGDTLVVEARESDGTFARHEITIPLLADLPEVKDSGRPPVISDVQVLKVKRGVFLSATIGWQTDTLTDAFVRYGVQDLSQKSQSRIRLGRRHEVVLLSLKPDSTYQFTAISRDLFGRSQVSEALAFSTSKPIAATQRKLTIKNSSQGKEKSRIASSFQRFGNDYLLELTLKQPASLNIGSKGVARSTKTIAANDKSHAGLNSKAKISLGGTCKSCHKKQATASHPVNVRPKRGMKVPSEYPTLPDGRISCNSCHSLHSSDFEFLTRKRGKRELCVGCHKDML